MSDLKQVIRGLQCLTHVDFAVYKSECEERQCPYRKLDCEIAVMTDALGWLEKMEKLVDRMKQCMDEGEDDHDTGSDGDADPA